MRPPEKETETSREEYTSTATVARSYVDGCAVHLHNDNDNILTGSAARPAAISIARPSDLAIAPTRPFCSISSVWIAVRPVTSTHLGCTCQCYTRDERDARAIASPKHREKAIVRLWCVLFSIQTIVSVVFNSVFRRALPTLTGVGTLICLFRGLCEVFRGYLVEFSRKLLS